MNINEIARLKQQGEEYLNKCPGTYILDENKNPIPASILEWGAFMENHEGRVVAYELIEKLAVSTVFLGIDHNLGGDKPLLFETMIFDEDRRDIYCNRYPTWIDAEKGHQEAIEWVKNGCKDEEIEE